MADFAHYFPQLLQNEGGYVFDPHDPGGETWQGVSRTAHPHWPGWVLIDQHKAAPGWPANAGLPPASHQASAILEQDHTLLGMVQSLYQTQYWDSLNLGGINSQCIASQLCDIGVNSGTGRVGKLAQFVLASSFGWRGALDGEIGPATLAGINAAPAEAYYNALVTARRAFYEYRAGYTTGIAPAFISFLQGVQLEPDPAMQRYLPSWLNRIAAIPFNA